MLKAEPNAKRTKLAKGTRGGGGGVPSGAGLHPGLLEGAKVGCRARTGSGMAQGVPEWYRCRAQCQRGPKGGVLATERPRSAPGQARKLRARR